MPEAENARDQRMLVGVCNYAKQTKKKIYNKKLQHKMRMTDSAVNDNTQIEF